MKRKVKKSAKPKKRLHFGVVFPALDNVDRYNLLEGIENYVIERDIHLTCFFGTYELRRYDFATYYEPCFDAINKSKILDGVIIYSGFIATNIGTEAFMDYIRSIPKNIPIISIGLEIPDTHCIITDNKAGIYNTVEHLVKEHNLKNIAFIKGPEDHPEGEARFSGYLEALADNNINRNDDLILPGDFTPFGGQEAIKLLVKERKAKFDAVVCCNDEEAVGAYKQLRHERVAIPKDTAVTGFDDVEAVSKLKPPLTTIKQDFSKLGVIACEVLEQVLRNEQVNEKILVAPELIIRRSCGCNKRTARKSSRSDGQGTRTRERVRRMVTDNLLLDFNLDFLAEELYVALTNIDLDFCLIGTYSSPIEGYAKNSDRTVLNLIGFNGVQKINIADYSTFGESPYPLSNYSNIKDINFEQRRNTLFSLPLFFGNEERGTAVVTYNEAHPVNWYETLRRTLSVAVKGADMLEKIQTLSVTDELTKLLNRRGFLQQVHSRLLCLQRQPEYCSVVFAMDMDGLKRINDTFGHAEGDRAICAYAEILRSSMRIDDIVSRTGGDEFIVFSVVKSVDDITKLEARIREKFANYNAEAKHPYAVQGSIGSAILSEPTYSAFDKAMLEADEALYVEKLEKRKQGLSRS